METNNTVGTKAEEEPITVEILWKIYTEARIVPMRFKPTGEIIDTTLQFCDQLEKVKEKYPL